jgi:outer membrane protein assembly factor BamB
MAMDKNTGEVFWTDNSPGVNILHGQWSSPTVTELGGVPQVLFAGGDGWLYSFRADEGKDGKPELLWKFDANPKASKYSLSGSATRNTLIGTPVVYDGLVYVAVGEDPEHGEGNGHLWCINPNRRGDVSPELAVKVDDRTQVIPHRRLQAVIEEEGEIAIDNPNSAVIWHYAGFDANGDGRLSFEEAMHRTIGSTAIKDDILYITDFSGLLHCLDAKTGKQFWTYDMLAASWGSPLIVDGKVYVGDENGDVVIFPLSREKQEPINEIWVGSAVYTTPVVANNTLFIANRQYLFSIANPDEAAAGK